MFLPWVRLAAATVQSCHHVQASCEAPLTATRAAGHCLHQPAAMVSCMLHTQQMPVCTGMWGWDTVCVRGCARRLKHSDCRCPGCAAPAAVCYLEQAQFTSAACTGGAGIRASAWTVLLRAQLQPASQPAHAL
jgi:hypothetical protein